MESERNNESRPTCVRYVVLSGLACVTMLNYFQRKSIGIAESTIREELGLSLEQMGWVMTSFGIAYAICQIPNGWLVQIYGPRRMLSYLSATWSTAIGSMALVGGYITLLTSQLFIGVFQSGIFPSTIHSVSRWFPSTQRAVASSVITSSMSVGAAATAALTGVLLQSGWGWREIFGMYMVPSLLWAIWFYLWYRDDPHEHIAVGPAELEIIERDGKLDINHPGGKTSHSVPWSQMLGSFTFWMLAMQHLLRGFGDMFFAGWFPTFLQETRGVGAGQSGLLTGLVLLSNVFGRISGGAISDGVLKWTGSQWLGRSGVAGVNLLACAGCVCGSYFVVHQSLALGLICMGTYFAGISAPCAHAAVIDKGLGFSAILFAGVNAVGSLDAFSPITVAKLVTVTGSWDVIPFFFTAVYVAAAVSWFAIPRRGTVFRKD